MTKYFLYLFLGATLLFGCSPKIQDASKSKTIGETASAKSGDDNMKLGAFSMSLNVKDLAVSKAFYEKLGFSSLGGAMDQNYLIMKNGNAIIGLFQGMFEGNIITFNPGWDESGKNTDPFDDVREIEKRLKAAGLTLTSETTPNTTGPANVVLMDPDGNMIFIDQHR